jgi:hypothetical protein
LSILHNTFFQSLTTLLFNLLTTHFNLSQHFFFNLQSLFNIFNNTFQSLMALFLLTTYVFMKPFPVIWDILRQSELMSNSSPLHPWYTCKVNFRGTMQQEKLWVSIKIMNSNINETVSLSMKFDTTKNKWNNSKIQGLEIKTYILNLVCTTRFWNNLDQARSLSRLESQII